MDKLWITILILFALNVWQSYLLFKKPTVENNIDNLKQKNKRNKGSNIDNDITPTINQENAQERKKRPKKGLIRRILTKKKKDV